MSTTSANPGDRVVHDADSHIIEPPGWLEHYASAYVAEHAPKGIFDTDIPALTALVDRGASRVAGDLADVTDGMKNDLFGHKEKFGQWTAFGAYDVGERIESLDLAGVSSQLVFPTLSLRLLAADDHRVLYEGADALNRGMADFCSADSRLLAVGFVPLNDPQRALECVRTGIAAGVKAFLLRSDAVEGRSPAHVDYDPVWAAMQDARTPIVLHIGVGKQFPTVYMQTGVERRLESSLANLESTKPHDVPVLHHSIERWLTSMIYFGVLDRFPDLKIGIIELGANWLPASMQNLDLGVAALGKFDAGLRSLSLKPSEYITRQVRATPFHSEDTGWCLRNLPKEILLFSTDYPHPEGGSDPFGDFARSLDAVDATSQELDHFYTRNFEDLMGLRP